MPDSSQVSVVIPTRNRPELVVRAVRSALAQTYSCMEIVVVLDGPDPAAFEALEAINDSRVRIVELPESRGGSGARNAGVDAAKGKWIAFLDDDDEWLEQKIELQMQLALRSRFSFPIISCRIIARTPIAEYLWPRRLPSAHEPVSDYLFCRHGLFQGEGLIATPTILTRRELLCAVPFSNALKKHQDWDWVIRACKVAGASLEFCPDALAICHMDQAFTGISNADDWAYSLQWIRNRRLDVTARAYAAFLLVVVAAQAAATSTAREYLALLSEAMNAGSPSLLEIALFAGMRVIPRGTRRRLRAAMGGAQ